MFRRRDQDNPNPFGNEITMEDLEKFGAVHGQNGVKTLSLAGKHRGLVEALSSEIGQFILNDVMVKMEVILEKIVQDKANKNEKAEYRVLRGLFNNWYKRIMIFEEAKKKIKET